MVELLINTVAIEAPFRQIDVLRIEFYSHKAAVPLQSDQARRPGTDERIEYQVAGVAAEQDARIDQGGREHRPVRLLIGLGVDVPDGPQIASVGSPHGFLIIKIALTLAEEEQVLMAARRPV